jgi:hypothetical protein
MGVYVWTDELKNAYIWIPNPTSIVLDKSVISLTTVWQTEQLTATIEPTVSDKTITWSSDDTTVATVSTTGLVTCVTPWTCTVTATTVNGLTATCSVWVWRIPSAYQEVEYIESSWTQKISTGYNTNSSIKIETDFMTTSSSGNQVLFWTTYWSWAWYDCLAFRSSSWFEAWAWWWNVIFYNFSINTKHTLEYTLSSATLDWTTRTYSRSSAGYELTIFYGNWKWWHARVYSFKIYTWTTLERDFVPCYRKLDSVIGLYDLVNDVFYTNSWSWAFTKWQDVN